MILEWFNDLLTDEVAPRETTVMSHNEAEGGCGFEDLPSMVCERCRGVVSCGGWLFMNATYPTVTGGWRVPTCCCCTTVAQ